MLTRYFCFGVAMLAAALTLLARWFDYQIAWYNSTLIFAIWLSFLRELMFISHRCPHCLERNNHDTEKQ